MTSLSSMLSSSEFDNGIASPTLMRSQSNCRYDEASVDVHKKKFHRQKKIHSSKNTIIVRNFFMFCLSTFPLMFYWTTKFIFGNDIFSDNVFFFTNLYGPYSFAALVFVAGLPVIRR